MKSSRRLAATSVLLLSCFAFLAGCDPDGGGGGGGGEGAPAGNLEASKPRPDFPGPNYTEKYLKTLLDGDQASTPDQKAKAGGKLFDNSRDQKDNGDVPPVVAGDGSGKKDPAPLTKPTPQAPKKDDVPSPYVASCRNVLKAHGQAADGCGDHATRALVWGGAKDAIREQFGTLEGIGATAAGLLLGYALSALSGVGTLAMLGRMAYKLLFGVGVWMVIKQAYQAYEDYKKYPQGTKMWADAVWRLSKLVVTAAIMVGAVKLGKYVGEKLPVRSPAAAVEPAAAPVESAAVTPAETPAAGATTAEATPPAPPALPTPATPAS